MLCTAKLLQWSKFFLRIEFQLEISLELLNCVRLKCLHGVFARLWFHSLFAQPEPNCNLKKLKNNFEHSKIEIVFKVKIFPCESVSAFVHIDHHRNQHGNSCHSFYHTRCCVHQNWWIGWRILEQCQRISIRLNSLARCQCFWHDNHSTSCTTLLSVVLLLNCISLVFVNVCSVIWNGFSDGKTFPEWTWSFPLKNPSGKKIDAAIESECYRNTEPNGTTDCWQCASREEGMWCRHILWRVVFLSNRSVSRVQKVSFVIEPTNAARSVSFVTPSYAWN